MSDEKYIKSLFDAARSEQPKLSFEEASKTFEDALRPGIAETVKDWLFNHINLNSFIMITAIGIILSAAFWGGEPTPKPNTETIFTTEITESQTIETDSLSPIKVTVETKNETVEISLNGDPSDIRVEKIEKKAEPEVSISEIETEPAPETFTELFTEPETPKIELPDAEKEVRILSLDDLKKKNRKKAERAARISSYSSDDYQKQVKKTGTRKMTEVEKVIGLTLNLDHLQNIFSKGLDKEYDQLILVTNRKFDHTIDIAHAGKPVIVTPDIHAAGFKPIGNYVDVKDLKIGDQKAYFKFYYGDNIVDTHLKKQDGAWYLETSRTDNEYKRKLSLEEVLIQNALNVDYLKEVFKKDENGDFLPVTLYTNGHFSRGLDIYFNEEKIEVYFNEIQSQKTISTPIIDVTKFKLKRKKMDFEFKYGEGKFSIVMKRKKDGKWHLRSIHYKEPGKIHSDIRF